MFERALSRLLYRRAGVQSARLMMAHAIELNNAPAAAYWARMTVRRSRALSRWTRLLCRTFASLAR